MTELRGHAVKKPKNIRIAEVKAKLENAEADMTLYFRYNGRNSERFYKKVDELKKQLKQIEQE